MRIAAVLLCLAMTLAAAVQEPKITSLTLANGMKVLIEEDHDIPNVAMYLFYRIGSRNERPGITGISHFFEHMMFNGAKKYGPKQFDIQMEKSGGNNNAYTTSDVTVYTNWFPSTALQLMMDMEADRIQHLSFDPKMIESERGVVASERLQSVDNSNLDLLYEQFTATAYAAHPYSWPVIGWASDIKAWTMDDLKAHFQMGYAPNNCLVVMVGAVKTEEALKLAKQYLEPIPRQEPPPPLRTIEPPQRGERRVTVVKPAQLPLQLIGYHVPNSTHADMPALEVLGTILSHGRSSRLYKRMVDGEQIALAADHSLGNSLDPGQMIFSIRPRAGVDPDKTERALLEELERVRSTEVPADELRKAKNQLLTDFFREMKTIAGRANLLGNYEIFRGDYRKLFGAQKEWEAVTAAQVQKVAKQYLTELNRTIATLVPEKAPAAAEVKQ
jgi:zinc protease